MPMQRGAAFTRNVSARALDADVIAFCDAEMSSRRLGLPRSLGLLHRKTLAQATGLVRRAPRMLRKGTDLDHGTRIQQHSETDPTSLIF